MDRERVNIGANSLRIKRMSKANWIFRWVVCELSIAEAATATGRTERTIRAWDAGANIPDELKAKMLAAAKRRPIGGHECWQNWHTRGEHLISDYGSAYTVGQLRTALWLLDEMRRDARPGQQQNGQNWWRRQRR